MIRLEGLRVRAGDFSLAIDDLAIAPGEYVIVLGPTGSGKTVLLETLAGLRRPQEGRVWFGERDVTGEPPESRGAGLVYQDYALFPHLTVAGNIGFGLRSTRTRAVSAVEGAQHVSGSGQKGSGRSTRGGKGGEARVRELAGLLGIDNLLDRYPEGLSGGEQQRVALARALAIVPDVLLLDEPLSALDGPTRLELQAELKRVHRELGATVMHVTHDLDEALALGDRVAVLIGGQLRQVGAPQQVTRAPVDTEVARLLGLTNVLAVASIDEEARDVQSGDAHDGGLAQDGRAPCARRRVQLSGGPELVAEGRLPALSSDRRFVVVRADEIAIQPLGDRSWDVRMASSGSGAPESGNVLDGTVRAIQVQSVHTSIEVELSPVDASDRPLVLTVHVLRPQVEQMALAVGSPVRLRIAPPAVHICSEGVGSGA